MVWALQDAKRKVEEEMAQGKKVVKYMRVNNKDEREHNLQQ
jgi:hypothetical protein